MPKAYPPEFRRRALDLVQAGRSVVQVAADLGISQGCLYSWRKQELIDTGQMPGVSSAQATELTTARRTHRARLAELPDGTIIDYHHRPWLVVAGELRAWTPGGYRDRQIPPDSTRVTVITPRATVAALAAGYQPVLHPTAH